MSGVSHVESPTAACKALTNAINSACHCNNIVLPIPLKEALAQWFIDVQGWIRARVSTPSLSLASARPAGVVLVYDAPRQHLDKNDEKEQLCTTSILWTEDTMCSRFYAPDDVCGPIP